MKGLIGILLLLILTAGCARARAPRGSWIKEGITEQEQMKDSYECKRDASMAQSVPEPGSWIYLWGGSTQGQMWENRARLNLMYECLQARGYRFVEEEK